MKRYNRQTTGVWTASNKNGWEINQMEGQEVKAGRENIGR